MGSENARRRICLSFWSCLGRQREVIVSDIEPDGPAEKAGLRIQDILPTLDGQQVGIVPLAEMIVSTGTASASGVLQIERDDKLMYITFEMH